ncbi:MAG: SURF1 family protein [Chromatiales bacterium]|nr:SURF1 family protein [Chromatiales bacterium]
MLCGTAVLAGLSLWQWSRSGEKQRLIDERVAAEAHGQFATPESIRADPGRFRYWQFDADGRYLAGANWLIDNQVRDGRLGYSVLSLFRTSDSELALIVDRGWIPADAAGVADGLDGPGASSRIRGRLVDAPDVGLRLGSAAEMAVPGIVQYLDIDAVSARLGRPLLPLVLELDADAPGAFERRRVSADPFGPDKHRAYSVQWALLAVVYVIVFTLARCARRGEGK